MLEWVRDTIERRGSVKVNTVFKSATKDKRANKSIITKNSKIYRCTDMREWYELHVVKLTLLEELQERDGWALSRILNLVVKMNKHNPMRVTLNRYKGWMKRLKRLVDNRVYDQYTR